MEPEQGEFDMEAGVASIAEGLGLTTEEDPDTPPETVDTPPETPDTPETPAVEVRPPPKSWAKETHDLWGKIPPEAQAQIEKREQQMLEGLEQYKGDSGFGRVMRETYAPYKALLQSQGVDELKATQALLNAHYKLSTLSGDQKIAYFAQIANTYGITIPGVNDQPQVHPALKAYQDRLDRLEGALTQRERAQYEEASARTAVEVTAFADAKDEKGQALHPYFDEVADDIITYINAGASLQDAYDRAVWANPVARQKEIARLQQGNAQALKEKAAAEAEKARKATSTNVRSRDTRKAPTEPLGKMDDTMRETLNEIRSRTH